LQKILINHCVLIVVGDDTWDDLSSSLSLLISDNRFEELPEGLSEILGIHEGEDNEAELDTIQDVVEQTIEKLKGKISLFNCNEIYSSKTLILIMSVCM